MCGGSPSVPAPPPVAPEAAQAPSAPAGGTEAGGRDARRRARATGEGGRSTILTSSRGVQDGAATTTKTLLGQ